MAPNPAAVKTKFFKVLYDAEANVSEFVKSPGKDMSRHRSCTFMDTVLATLRFTSHRTNTELLNYFMDSGRKIPSKSAFCQQRSKLNDKLFPHIFKEFNRAFPLKKTFKGYHLLAVDGSDINLPADKNDHVYRVKQARSDRYYYQMHVNALYDICENRYVDIVVQPRPQMNESKALLQMIARGTSATDNTIFIADRGYCTYNTIAYLTSHRKYFIIRAKKPDSKGGLINHLVKADAADDKTVSLGITHSRRKNILNNPEKFRYIRPYRTFDFLSPNDHETIYYLNIRVVAINLENGSFEYLITNLPPDKFTSDDLKLLYKMRWNIETSFRSLKYALSLVYLHSVNRELIIQELYAKFILYNFSSLLHQYAESLKEKSLKNKTLKHEYKVSFDDTIPLARSFLKKKMSNKTIKALLLRHLTPIIKGISKPRLVRSQTVKPLNNRA